MDNIFNFIEKPLSNLNLMDPIYDFFREIVIALMLIFFKKASLAIKSRLNEIRDKKAKQLINVSQTQIGKYADGRVESQNEKHDALNYLQHDLHNKLDSINFHYLNLQRKFYVIDSINDFLSIKNIVLISVAVLIAQIIGIVLKWDFVDRLFSIYAYLFPGFILIINMIAVIKDLSVNRSNKQEIDLFMKEINSALLTIGSNPQINLFNFLEISYDRKTSIDPKEIQKIFSLIGVKIKIEEITRVVLAYQYKNTDGSEKEALSIKILEDVFKNLGIDYNEISLTEKGKLQKTFFEAFINDPMVAAEIFPL